MSFVTFESFSLGKAASLGQWNWVSAAGELECIAGPKFGTLRLADGAAVTSRHYFDASGGICIGQFSTVAGVRSVFLTHEIDINESRQTCQSIEIGEYALVSSCVKVVAGATIPDRSLVAMGSVITRAPLDPQTLIAGVPARSKAKLSPESKYFARSHPRVQP